MLQMPEDARPESTAERLPACCNRPRIAAAWRLPACTPPRRQLPFRLPYTILPAREQRQRCLAVVLTRPCILRSLLEPDPSADEARRVCSAHRGFEDRR